MIPLIETAAAASCGGVLRFKNRVAFEWGLFAVIFGFGWGNAFLNEIASVHFNLRKTDPCNVGAVIRIQMKLSAEL